MKEFDRVYPNFNPEDFSIKEENLNTIINQIAENTNTTPEKVRDELRKMLQQHANELTTNVQQNGGMIISEAEDVFDLPQDFPSEEQS